MSLPAPAPDRTAVDTGASAAVFAQVTPRTLLLPALAKSHPGLR